MINEPNEADILRPVQAQLDAYNAKDIDRFMQWWADDCQYHLFPSELLADGAAQIRERHILVSRNRTCTRAWSIACGSATWSSIRNW
jgi:hypothetical protein